MSNAPAPRFRLAFLLSLLACAGCSGNREMISAPDQQLSPSLVRAAQASGDAAAGAGQFLAAAGLYERAYRARPTPELAVLWGRSLRLGGDPQSGYLALKDASARYPRNAAVATELGRCAASGGYRQEAAQAFTRALALPDAGWGTYMADGAFEATSNNASQAAGLFSRALGLARSDREHYDAMANLAFLKAQNGDLYGGLSEMREIASHPGVDPKIHADLALLDSRAGDKADYAEQMSQAGLQPDEAARINSWLDGGAPSPLSVQAPSPVRRRHVPLRTSPSTSQSP